MTPFTFTYHEQECSGKYLPSDKGQGWIKVIFFDHSAVILQTTIQTKGNKNIWVQHIQQAEAVWPHELIQTMGESIALTPSLDK